MAAVSVDCTIARAHQHGMNTTWEVVRNNDSPFGEGLREEMQPRQAALSAQAGRVGRGSGGDDDAFADLGEEAVGHGGGVVGVGVGSDGGEDLVLGATEDGAAVTARMSGGGTITEGSVVDSCAEPNRTASSDACVPGFGRGGPGLDCG